MVGALPHLLADGFHNLGHAVRLPHAETHGVAAVATHAEIGAAAGVAVSAGRPERGARDEQTRSRDVTLFDRELEAPVGAAGITHAGEAAIEHAEHQPCGPRRHQGQWNGLEEADVHFTQDHVDMAVDQPGHQRPSAAVDDVGALGLNRFLRDLPDGLTLDQEFEAALKLAGFWLKQLEIPKQQLRHVIPRDAQ